MPDAGEGAQTDLGLRAAGRARRSLRGRRMRTPPILARPGCLAGACATTQTTGAGRCEKSAAYRDPGISASPAAKPLTAPSTRPSCAVRTSTAQRSPPMRAAGLRRRGHAGHACCRRGAAEHPNATRRPDNGARLAFDEFPIPDRQSRAACSRPGSAPHSCACCAGACAPPSSWSRKSTARRRCGITMEPPTTSPTEKVSKNSSRLTPASLHWAT